HVALRALFTSGGFGSSSHPQESAIQKTLYPGRRTVDAGNVSLGTWHGTVEALSGRLIGTSGTEKTLRFQCPPQVHFICPVTFAVSLTCCPRMMPFPAVFLGFYVVHARLTNVLMVSERAVVSNGMRKYLFSILQWSPRQIVSCKTIHEFVRKVQCWGSSDAELPQHCVRTKWPPSAGE
ncbi:hypothetical protein KC19_6G114100, partial [Ceratodon purpureus]